MGSINSGAKKKNDMATLKYRFCLNHVTGLSPVNSSIADKSVIANKFSKNVHTGGFSKGVLNQSCFWNIAGNNSGKWNMNMLFSSNNGAFGHWHITCLADCNV